MASAADTSPGTLDPRILEGLRGALADQPADVAGVRWFGVDALGPYLAAEGAIGAVAQAFLAPGAKPVRAILFDKTPAADWAVWLGV